MQQSNRRWYQWFGTPGDHWWVIFWTLFGAFFMGPLVARHLTDKAERRGEPTRRYWQAFGGTLALEAIGLVLLVVIGAIALVGGSHDPTSATNPYSPIEVTSPTQSQASTPTALGSLTPADIASFCSFLSAGVQPLAAYTDKGPTGWMCGNKYDGAWYQTFNMSAQDMDSACDYHYDPDQVQLSAVASSPDNKSWSCYTG